MIPRILAGRLLQRSGGAFLTSPYISSLFPTVSVTDNFVPDTPSLVPKHDGFSFSRNLSGGSQKTDAGRNRGAFQTVLAKIEKQRLIKQHISFPEFLKLCTTGGSIRYPPELIAKELLDRGVVVRFGHQVYLDGDEVAARVASAIPCEPDEVERKLEALRREIVPLDKEKSDMDNKAFTLSKGILYGGLGLLVVQWGVFFRLTFWDYSWDVMEPVTYFVSLTFGMGAYVYFLSTRKRFKFRDLYDRLGNAWAGRMYKANAFDMERYKRLEGQISVHEKYLDSERKNGGKFAKQHS